MKKYYSAAELAGIGLKKLPVTIRGIQIKATKEAWPYVEVAAKGGPGGKRREYAPPAEIMAAIFELQKTDLLEQSAPVPMPALVESESTGLAVSDGHGITTERQRQVESARLGVLNAIERLMTEGKVGKDAAITTLLTQARLPQFANIAKLFELARDGRGRHGDLPSPRSIKRWFERRESNRLMPEVRQAEAETPEWALMFLGFYRQPQKPSVEMAYRLFEVEWALQQPLAKLPSIHQVRRFLSKLGNVSKERGRMGERELKDIQPYKIREFAHLQPTDIYTADGHTFDAEVMHPDSGKPFRPEVTTIVDVATRKAVGFSVDLAESAIAVLVAIGHASVRCGIGAVFYVDNGRGYVNDMMSDEAVGLMGRLGMTMKNSRAYSSQARGVIERSHQTIWVNAAKNLQSFIGKSMDAEAKQLVHKTSRKAAKNGISLKQVPALARIKSLNPNLIPSWEDFKDFCAAQVEWYNNRPHKALPKVLDENGKKRHMTPNECWALKVAQGAEIVTVAENEKQMLFMPQVLRKVARGYVSWRNNKYFSAALEEYHGDMVRVAYDIHDAENVWIYDDVGRFIGKADWTSNRIAYMPVNEIEQAKEKRVNAQLKRLARKGADIEAARPARVIEHQASVNLGGVVLDMSQLKQRGDAALANLKPRLDDVDAVVVERPSEAEDDGWQVPGSGAERFELYQRLKNTADLPTKAAKWVELYPNCAEYKALSKRAAAL